MFNFKDKVVWVTGSTSGIGRATIEAFVDHGANVVVHNYDNPDAAVEIMSQLETNGTRALLVEGDLTDKKSVEAMVEQIQQTFGRLDVLVNNAGASPFKSSLIDMKEEHWDRVIEINLKSMYLVTQAALPLLKKQEIAKIINTCSTVSRSGGVKGGIAYTAAKGGVDSFTRGLARELAGENILVNGVGPGLVDSAFHDVNVGEKYPQLIETIPLKRVGKPQDLAGAILFFASDYANYITGEILEVSGGNRLR